MPLNMFRKKSFPILVILFFLNLSAVYSANDTRIQFNLNTDWAFWRGEMNGAESIALDESKWMPATIPHIMQLEKKHCGGDVIYNGIGWYRRHFKLDAAYKGKKIWVSFEGVMKSCKVYLNGKQVAINHGGYIGFVADLTDLIRFGGDNVLAVRVTAENDPLTPPGKPQNGLDFYYYSGIYRDVNLFVTDPLYITDPLAEKGKDAGGVFVTYPEVTKQKAMVKVSTHLRNNQPAPQKAVLTTLLIDNNGKMLSQKNSVVTLQPNSGQYVIQNFTVNNPRLWSPYSPQLYSLKVQIKVGNRVVDEVKQTIGIRTIRFSTEDGFFINGEHIYLRGANRHQQFPYVGDAASNSMQERDVIDMKRGGFNAVRAAHYPNDPAFLEACDKHGLLVVECIPGWQFFNRDTTFINRMYEVGRSMIRRDRNHPSVILWETALNETHYPRDMAAKILKNIYDLAHKEYPGDQMYTAGDYFGFDDVLGFYDVFYKQVSQSPKDGDVMSNFLEDQIAVAPLLSREWGDGVGEKPRVSLMENEEELLKQCSTRYDHLEGRGYFDWCMLDANKRNAGHFLWSYNDYNRGCCEETMFSGAVDVNRYPKYNYYMLQSMRDKNISQKGLYSGPMVYVASYNSNANMASSSRAITVFSNCDEVRLFRNSKLIGTQTRQERAKVRPHVVEKGGSPDFVFEVNGYEAGELKAEGFIHGKVVATHFVRTPEAAHHLEVVIKHDNMIPVADGSDMIPVYIKVCDKNGTLVNSSTATVNLSINGEGHIIGEGIDRIGISKQTVEGGVGFAFVRTTKKAGKISVMADALGLQSGEASITSIPFTGKYLPDGEHQPYKGNEEDNVMQRLNTHELSLLKLPVLKPDQVTATNTHTLYPVKNLTDGDDRSWWIADTDVLPQSVTFSFNTPVTIQASRVLFQKDSSMYGHKVEVSEDGQIWTVIYERECTGWDFKPREINCKNVKFFRITINSVTGGKAGMGEVTLFGK
jgi:beta-galactosidase